MYVGQPPHYLIAYGEDMHTSLLPLNLYLNRTKNKPAASPGDIGDPKKAALGGGDWSKDFAERVLRVVPKWADKVRPSSHALDVTYLQNLIFICYFFVM